MLLYDGDCGFCGAAVRFVLRHDRRRVFRFASLTSPVGMNLPGRHGVSSGVDSLVVLQDGTARIRSDAVLTILRHLGGWWHLLRIGAVLPRAWRDALYDAVAARRHEFSARRGMQCLVPDPADRDRFL